MRPHFYNSDGTPVLTGYFWVNDVPLMQTLGVQERFTKIVQSFEQIIEIGFSTGGLSLLLHLVKPPTCTLVSYDITRASLLVPESYGIDFRIGDCLARPTAEEIFALMRLPKRTLVLCDGGNKHNEFVIYGEHLKPNDVIMLHDYADDPAEFDRYAKAVEWNTPAESFYEVIAPFVRRYGLERFRYDEMKAVFWGSFIKPPV